jgi:hypothetical protein
VSYSHFARLFGFG